MKPAAKASAPFSFGSLDHYRKGRQTLPERGDGGCALKPLFKFFDIGAAEILGICAVHVQTMLVR